MLHHNRGVSFGLEIVFHGACQNCPTSAVPGACSLPTKAVRPFFLLAVGPCSVRLRASVGFRLSDVENVRSISQATGDSGAVSPPAGVAGVIGFRLIGLTFDAVFEMYNAALTLPARRGRKLAWRPEFKRQENRRLTIEPVSYSSVFRARRADPLWLDRERGPGYAPPNCEPGSAAGFAVIGKGRWPILGIYIAPRSNYPLNHQGSHPLRQLELQLRRQGER